MVKLKYAVHYFYIREQQNFIRTARLKLVKKIRRNKQINIILRVGSSETKKFTYLQKE